MCRTVLIKGMPMKRFESNKTAYQPLFSMTEFLNNKRPHTLFKAFFILKLTKIHISSPNQTVRSLRIERGNTNF